MGRIFLVYGLTAIIAYLLGSISFAVIITKLFIKQDIRALGSGNAGATNVLRSVGGWAALLTLIGDFGKGILAVFIGRILFNSFDIQAVSGANAESIGASVAGLFALIGHIVPCFFGFKGGKGVLTAGGIMLLMSPTCFLVCLAIFLLTLAITRYVSLSSCIGVGAYPIVMFITTFVFQYWQNDNVMMNYWVVQTITATIFAGLVIFLHRENIKRLIAGTERKLTMKKTKTEENDG